MIKIEPGDLCVFMKKLLCIRLSDDDSNGECVSYNWAHDACDRTPTLCIVTNLLCLYCKNNESGCTCLKERSKTSAQIVMMFNAEVGNCFVFANQLHNMIRALKEDK